MVCIEEINEKIFFVLSLVLIIYSATEGADSHPASGDEGQLGEEGQIGQGKGDDVKSTCHKRKKWT